MPFLATLRRSIQSDMLREETALMRQLLVDAKLSPSAREAITARAIALIGKIRSQRNKGLMETFLVEYGLSTNEGLALMCLAEALLRVPDAETIDALIEDKIAPSDWGSHFGKSSSALVNASTLGLMVTGLVLDERMPGIAGAVHGMVKRLGEPVIRTAVGQAMREMGRQFVLGRTIGEAMDRAARREAKGYTHSYDMLGEAALTDADAQRYFARYTEAIAALGKACSGTLMRANPGISIKLSALFARYERSQRHRVLSELAPRVLELARLAKAANMGLTIDAEEADRLDLSLDVIEAVLSDPSLAGWDGLGAVVQSYGRTSGHVIDWLYQLALTHDRRICVRLVKGAYWDSEVKMAQMLGLADYPLFTHKPATDLSYIANARKLLDKTDRLYPQFATHNAQTMAAILEMAGDRTAFEFQRLHGMGAALHEIVHDSEGTACRIYAPVGAHRDLLAYLVRRLLENGANSSFVNQLVDEEVPPERVAADPLALVETLLAARDKAPSLPLPADIYQPERANSRGWNLSDPIDEARFEAARAPWRSARWQAGPRIVGTVAGSAPRPVENPARVDDEPGEVIEASPADVETALASARTWDATALERAYILRKAADLFEANSGEFFALAAREAGKSAPDAVAELREAIDFLRYYAGQAEGLDAPARGIFTCISPWNFPLAIFTGQVAAALAAGNAVIAKPAETTPLIAARAIDLLLDAGVPQASLQFLPGAGPKIGAALSSDPRVAGICFTGSLATAQRINRAMAANLSPHAPLIAETGGINAMIVDSTALPEQAVRDIVTSAFRSAGQRCSALRVLYVQEDIATSLLEMLYGAMDELTLGDPWALATDIGPLIDAKAFDRIAAYVDRAEKSGRVLHRMAPPASAPGHFLGPCVISVGGIGEVTEEIFGPVLHVATFKASDLPRIVADINASGSGLTFGLHTRIDERIEELAAALRVGNVYVNRNQIGAIVGSQPFGGEGLSGTGPKAGGPSYLRRFTKSEVGESGLVAAKSLEPAIVTAAIRTAPRPDPLSVLERRDMPGVTGESNRLSLHPRGLVLCLGPGREDAEAQAALARSQGCAALTLVPSGDCDGALCADGLAALEGEFDAVMYWGPSAEAKALRIVLAGRDGRLIPLITETNDVSRLHLERHLCVNTTASGGNAKLLAGGGR